MHLHIHTKTEIAEGSFDSTTKRVYRVCRCGDRKLVRIAMLHQADFSSLRVNVKS